jgi:hypothetical protein
MLCSSLKRLPLIARLLFSGDPKPEHCDSDKLRDASRRGPLGEEDDEDAEAGSHRGADSAGAAASGERHEGQRDLPRAQDKLSHLLHLEEAVRGSTKTQERIGAWAELALVIFTTNGAFPAELSDDLVEVRSAPQGSET